MMQSSSVPLMRTKGIGMSHWTNKVRYWQRNIWQPLRQVSLYETLLWSDRVPRHLSEGTKPRPGRSAGGNRNCRWQFPLWIHREKHDGNLLWLMESIFKTKLTHCPPRLQRLSITALKYITVKYVNGSEVPMADALSRVTPQPCSEADLSHLASVHRVTRTLPASPIKLQQ